MRNAGKVVTRTMLLERVWNYHFDPQTNIVDTHISRLRSKLNEGGKPDAIETVRGAGYRMAGMRNWRRSAAYRIAFVNFGAYAIGLALLGAVVFAVIHAAFTRQLDAMVTDDAQTLAGEFSVRRHDRAQRSDRSSARPRQPDALCGFRARRPPISGSLQSAKPPLGVREIGFADPVEGPDLARSAVVDLSPNARLVVAVDSDWLEQFEQSS